MATEKIGDFLTWARTHRDPTISPTADRISFPTGPKSVGGDGTVTEDGIQDLKEDPNTGQPLLSLDDEGEAGLMGDYLHWLTSEIKFHMDPVSKVPANVYAVKMGNEEAAPSIRGAALVLAENQGATNVYVPQTRAWLFDPLSTLSNSGKFDNANPDGLQGIVDKDLTTKDSNHNVLSDIRGKESINGATGDNTGRVGVDTSSTRVTDAVTAVSQIGRDYNFWQSGINLGKHFVERDEGVSGGAFDNRKKLSTVDETTSFGMYSKDNPRFAMKVLKDVGLSLLLNAARYNTHFDSSKPGDKSDPKEIIRTVNEEAQSSKSSPVDEENFSKIPSTDLRARNAFGAPQRTDGTSLRSAAGDYVSFVGTDAEGNPLDFSPKSYGTTTYPGMEFTLSNSALLFQAAAAITAIISAMSTLDDLVSNTLSGYDGESRVDMGQGPYYHGEHPISTKAKYNLLKKVVLVPTVYSYADAVKAGKRVLFGVSDDIEDVARSPTVAESPGYWLAVCRSAMRRIAEAEAKFLNFEILGTGGDSAMSQFIAEIGKSGVLSFMNVLATVGDSLMQATGGSTSVDALLETGGPFDVDALPTGPATRISKSRQGLGTSAMSLAWRGNSVPSIYMVPKNVISTAVEMGTVMFGTNPVKGLLGADSIKRTFLDKDAVGPNARIAQDIVERLENALDAEYVPFYFHDLRTNEILSFHAFLDDLSETYQVGWNDVGGYGRMDPVKIFKGTTRSVELGFTVVATSPDDFDEMWYKINKFFTLLYPQWSSGKNVQVTTPGGKTNKFVQPFSQVMSASPLIRLRVGDVLKTNYSKFHLARIFGIGDATTDIQEVGESAGLDIFPKLGDVVRDAGRKAIDGLFYTLYGSPLAGGFGIDSESRIVRSLLSILLNNGFANPLAVQLVDMRLRDPDSVLNPVPASLTLPGAAQALGNVLQRETADIAGYFIGEMHYLKPNTSKPYIIDGPGGGNGERWRITRSLRVMIIGIGGDIKQNTQSIQEAKSGTVQKGLKNTSKYDRTKRYRVMIFDFNAPFDLFGRVFLVTHSDILPNPNSLFNLPFGGVIDGGFGLLKLVADFAMREAAQIAGIPADTLSLSATTSADFMAEKHNPIVKSFNSTRGRGLAGAITSVNVDWLEFPWETEWNSRAPIGCKFRIRFEPIHDITPGIDYSGFNRAPIYNVGKTMEHVAGDPYDDDGVGSKSSFTNAGRLAAYHEGKIIKGPA